MLLDLFLKGGPVMWPILICSIIALAVFIERLWVLQRKKVIPPTLFANVKGLVDKGKISEARTLCDANNSSIAKVLSSVLNTGYTTKIELKEAVEDAGKREIRLLEKRVGILGVIAGVGPLLGLFGTVTGMVQTFQVISVIGTGDAGKLAGGISEALITTEFGLFVAIPALVAHKICTSKAESLTYEMEQSAFKIISLLKLKRVGA